MGSPHPLNGSAVDLAAVKARADQRAALEQQRDQLTTQLLTQVGLMCPCGERIRGEAVIYFMVVEGEVPTPNGPQMGINLQSMTYHSRTCPAAIAAEAIAIARREGLAGRITWLDERREARASRGQG